MANTALATVIFLVMIAVVTSVTIFLYASLIVTNY